MTATGPYPTRRPPDVSPWLAASPLAPPSRYGRERSGTAPSRPMGEPADQRDEPTWVRRIGAPGGRCGRRPAWRRPRGMDEVGAKVRALLQEAAETHHRVYRITDGADDDWASWYADWLVRLSELPGLLGGAPVRSELVYMLVRLDKEYTEQQPVEPWEDYYA